MGFRSQGQPVQLYIWRPAGGSASHVWARGPGIELVHCGTSCVWARGICAGAVPALCWKGGSGWVCCRTAPALFELALVWVQDSTSSVRAGLRQHQLQLGSMSTQNPSRCHQWAASDAAEYKRTLP